MIRAAAAALFALAPMAVGAEGLPFPVKVGGPFALVDGSGQARSEVDPDGHLQLLFFGYANCPSICAVALPAMAEAVEAAAAAGLALRPVMITIDPERDTVETIAAPLAAHHPDFVGLTGSPEALAAAWRAFGIERTVVFEDPGGGPVFAHGAFVYLLSAQGTVLSVLPPVLAPERIVEIARGHAGG